MHALKSIKLNDPVKDFNPKKKPVLDHNGYEFKLVKVMIKKIILQITTPHDLAAIRKP